MSVVSKGAYAAAAAVARLRSARLLHPRGRAFQGIHTKPHQGRLGARLLDRPGSHRVTVRISKATPTPAGWPDVYGLAIRLHRGWRRPREVDLLLSTSSPRPLLRPGVCRLPAGPRGARARRRSAGAEAVRDLMVQVRQRALRG